MSDINFESFNFSDLAGENPFGEQKKSFVDERFYKLERDADDNGTAIIRFLPDPEKKLIQQLYKINVNTQRGAEKRWFNDWSPQNIGRQDPFHEHWSKLWNAGQKDESRKFARQTRYIANILVVKDPSNPENEGKVFLLDMSQSLKSIVENALMPTKADIALGAKPAQLFNPLQGQNFLLKCKKGSNGFITYEPSAVIPEVNSVFDTKEQAVDVIMNQCHKLSDFLDPSLYKTDEELKEKLDYVLFKDADSQAPKADEEVTDVTGLGDLGTTKTETKTSDLDAFLDGVM